MQRTAAALRLQWALPDISLTQICVGQVKIEGPQLPLCGQGADGRQCSGQPDAEALRLPGSQALSSERLTSVLQWQATNSHLCSLSPMPLTLVLVLI